MCQHHALYSRPAVQFSGVSRVRRLLSCYTDTTTHSASRWHLPWPVCLTWPVFITPSRDVMYRCNVASRSLWSVDCSCTDTQINSHSFNAATIIMPPTHRVGTSNVDGRCLSVCPVSDSRIEGRRKLKIGRKEAHNTGDPWPPFRGR